MTQERPASMARERAPDGRHRTPRPLPEPHRSRRVSRSVRPPADRFGRLLEEWLADLPLGYTYSAD